MLDSSGDWPHQSIVIISCAGALPYSIVSLHMRFKIYALWQKDPWSSWLLHLLMVELRCGVLSACPHQWCTSQLPDRMAGKWIGTGCCSVQCACRHYGLHGVRDFHGDLEVGKGVRRNGIRAGLTLLGGNSRFLWTQKENLPWMASSDFANRQLNTTTSN